MIRDAIFIPAEIIEEKALKMLAGFESQYGKIVQPPVPIDRIVERYLDLWIDWDDIEDTDDEKILAYLDPDNKKIRMNTKRRDHFEGFFGTESYTKAHEVGHWDLHVVKSGETQIALPFFTDTKKYLCRQSTKDSREIQAEMYAAYLLMPYPLVMQTINGLNIWNWHKLYDLQKMFGVSITAFTKRLKGLNLIYIAPDKGIFHSEAEYQGYKAML